MVWVYRPDRALMVFLLAGGLVLTGCGVGAKKSVSRSTSSSLTTAATTPVPVIPNAVQMAMTVTDDSAGGAPELSTWTEVQTEDGSYRNTAADGSDDEAYDAPSRTLSSHIVTSGRASLNVQTNVPFAPPDRATLQGDALAQYVESQQASGNPQVTSVTVLGRSAYNLQFVIDSPTVQFDRASVTVDAQTGLLLLADTTKNNKPYIKWAVTAFNVNPDMSKVSFVIEPKNGDDVNRSDAGFIDTQTSLVKDQVGYAPLLPQNVPVGFSISRVITRAARGETTGANGSNPQNQGVVVEMFQDAGWSKLYTTTRQSGGDPSKWSDPLADVSGQFDGAAQVFSVTGGAMASARGQSVISPAESPHIWAAGTSLVATVSGPFSFETLNATINSLS